MKKTLYSLAIIALPFQLFAQPTIYNMGNNPIGMVAKFLYCDNNGVSAGFSGATQTWNMSSMVMYPRSQSDTLTEYTIANYGTVATTASRIDSFSQNIPLVGGNEYIQQSLTRTYLQTLYYSPTSYAIYTSPSAGLTIAEQPITYMTTFSGGFSNTYYSPPNSPATTNSSFTTTVDGYGTLVLPGPTTYNNVVRLHTVEYDTNVTSVPNLIDSRSIYQWYDNNHSVPLCVLYSITSSSSTSYSYYYLLSQSPLVKVDNITNKQIAFTACFYGNDLIVNSEFEQGHNYAISVFNLSGQLAFSDSFSPSGNSYRFYIDKWLTPGIYAVLLADKTTQGFSTIKVLR